jgi:hypothetical protein
MTERTFLKHWLILAGLALVVPTMVLSQEGTVSQEFVQLESKGAAVLDNGPTTLAPTALNPDLELPRQSLEALTQMPRTGASRIAAPLTFPNVKNNEVATSNPNFFGFGGLDHADQRLAGTGKFVNTQFSLEPPDQGFCVGNEFALETVNTALAVYKKDNGALLAGPTALNQFFGLQPEVVRTRPPVFGDFTSDPRCHYDAATNRFFVTLLQIDVVPSTGQFAAGSSLLIAVSQTGDPTKSWNLFRLHTTTHGVGCPCFGDQPLIGFDANGLYLSTNAFSLVTGNFAGNQLYAMSKQFLAAGAAPPFVLRIGLPPVFNADGSLDASVHPASNTRGNEGAHFGSEYFLSSFDITSTLDNKLVVWALQNTSLLNSPPGPHTIFHLFRKAIPSEVYGVPPDALQKMGTLPFGSVVNPGVFEILATNEHRMQQVTFANGRLWSAVTTGLTSPGESNLKAGIAWFSVEVETEEGRLDAAVEEQGYVVLANGSVFFPAVGVNSEGNAAIGFSLSSPSRFPSTGYVKLGGNGNEDKIHIAGAGVNSEDGFTGYPNAVSVPPPCLTPVLCEARWGDYGAAAVDADGSIWLANEYIGPRPRTSAANWGTFITRLSPNGNDD